MPIFSKVSTYFTYKYRAFLFRFFKLIGLKIKLVDMEKFSMFLDLVTPGISQTLFIRRTREEDKIFLLDSLFPERGDIIDCGSNTGFYPIYLSRLMNKNQKLISLEPDLRNFRILSLNQQFFEISDSNYKLINAAAHSENCSSAQLDVSSVSNMSRLIVNSNIASNLSLQDTQLVKC